MGGKKPVTVMTDQCQSMASSLRRIIPEARHRLCTWHIGENAHSNIKALLKTEGFETLFDYCLKYTDTIEEFNHYWSSLKDKYQCGDNPWIKRLKSLHELWCPAYSKDYFSGGVLSSQRSESTNNALKRKLHKSNGLCDFFKAFNILVQEGRSTENIVDYSTQDGNRYLAFQHVPILVHAQKLYTIPLYLQFEDRFIKGVACSIKTISRNNQNWTYLVGRPATDFIMHTVAYNHKDKNIECTCKSYTETGLLCAHALRVYLNHSVQKIPNKYIMKRWTKQAMNTEMDDYIANLPQVIVPASI